MPHTYQRRGADILVNTVTNGFQTASNISALNDGGFIVIWTDSSGEGADPGTGVKAQRFDAVGSKVGGEFLVNTNVVGNQLSAQLATLPSGRYVVTWTDSSGAGDASGSGIKGQIFEADGTRVGGEFLVNTETASNQGPSSVTELAGGGFVVSWQDSSLLGGDSSGSGIKAQLFDAAGAKVGAEFLVNTVTSGSQSSPSIATMATGGFAAAWIGATVGSSPFVHGSIRLQLFDAAGAKVGGEVIANTNDLGNLVNPRVTALSSGLLVTWAQSESAAGGGNFDIKAQLFDPSGAKVGGEFTVNTTTQGSQLSPDADPLPGGGFLITWGGPGAGLSGSNIYGQVFDAAGAKVGVEFIVGSVIEGSQTTPRVDVLSSGDIVVIWSDQSGIGGDASASAVKAQILTISTDPPTDISLPDNMISETAREDVPLLSLHTVGTINSSYTYTIVSDSSGGAFAIDGDRLVVHDNSMLDFETHPQVTLRLRATDDNGNSYEESFQLDIADTPESGYEPATAEFLVHTTLAVNQSEPFILPLDTGGYVVTWIESPLSGDGVNVGKGRLFDADGNPVTGELAIDGLAAAALPGGGFVTIASGSDGSASGVVARIYDSAGAQVGGVIHVNTLTAGQQDADAVAALPSGGFVVTWTDYSGGGFQGDVKARIFDNSGTPVGDEFMVPTLTTDVQQQSDVTALTSGNFVVTWTDGVVKAQIFSASGVRLGQPITVYADRSVEGHVAALADGGFVITWTRNTSSGGFTSLADFSAQVFDAAGTPVGDVILIDPGVGRVVSTDVSALPWGGFVATWAGYDNPSTNDPGIRAQVFDGTGAKVGTEFFVSDPAVGEQFGSDVGVLASGDFVVGWTEAAGANGFDSKTRIYALVGGATEGDDVLAGTSGDDTISGLGGNDVIDGGAGNDIMAGGSGNDTYVVDAPGDVVVENIGGGDDRVLALSSYALAAGAEVELLSAADQNGVGALDLTGNDFNSTMIGNEGVNTIDGRGGNDVIFALGGDDTLDGGSGNDYLAGGSGNDTYLVDSFGDVVVENAGEGSDRVLAQASYRLGAGAEVELLSAADQNGAGALDLTGNNLNSTIIGNEGVNSIEGRGGNDVIFALGGADVLDGGTGNDYLAGGTGDDIYVVDSAGDVVVENAGEGSDRVLASASYTLAAGAEVELLSAADQNGAGALDLAGNNLNSTIIGNEGTNTIDGRGGNDVIFALGGDDVLDGGAGNDYLAGGTGSDTYLVDSAGDVVVENAGEGSDRVLALASYVLAAGAEVELLSAQDQGGMSAIGLTGNAFASTIIGNEGANSIDGRGGNDTIYALGGDDVLDGGTGNDYMLGGTGNDTYLVDSAGDTVVENAGEGSDRVLALASYTLAAGAEVELLSAQDQAGTSALDLTGNAFSSTIIGNDGANNLSGLGGNDTIYGLGGADVLDGGTGNDYLIGGGGADTFAFTTTLGGNVDTIADFAAVDDTIALDDAVFTALGLGVLNANAFVTGTAAQDADDRIIYDSSTGALYYDADGNGAGAAVQFATLGGAPVITASDFTVI